MPIVGGLDIHRKQLTFDYLDTETGEVKRGQVAPADRAHLRAWLAKSPGRRKPAAECARPFHPLVSRAVPPASNSCRISRVWVGQSGWRPVMLTAAGPARARVSARRSASGSRYRLAMRRTRSAASALGIPAVVTNNGRTEDPRTTGTAWVAVRNLDLATAITGMPDSACARAPRPGRPLGSRSA
jgi:hypothetical protein